MLFSFNKKWKKMNVNLIKINNSDSILSFSDIQEIVVNFFKKNPEIYQDMLNSYEAKNGNK